MPRLTTIPFNAVFDMEPWIGQRSSRFHFNLLNGLTGERLGEITPLRTASLSHDSNSTISRRLNIALGKQDTADINTLTDRIEPTMEVDGVTYPLGHFMFTGQTDTRFTSGSLGNDTLSDEMFRVDQPLVAGINGTNKTTIQIYNQALVGQNVDLVAESSPYTSAEAWGVGQTVGNVLKASAVTGDYFNPWFGNDGKLHLIRSFNPADRVPQFDYDAGNQVLREGITDTSNLLTAPNRFLVISNTGAAANALVGVSVVPPSAPNSFANRGFYITSQQTLQLASQTQANAVAIGLANRQTIFEQVTLNTPPDPRHDSYDVIVWQGALWLELSWSMQLTPGGQMSHTLRKGYVSSE